jgi:excisionase family DNA binding protein
MPDRRPYTTKTAAEYLGASPAHVRNLCARGKLRYFRLGGDVRGPIRIPADALEEFERARRRTAKANKYGDNGS